MQQIATVTSTGAAITYDNGAFAVGGEPADIQKVLEYDKLGVLSWASDETKAWAYQLVSAAPAVVAAAPAAQPVAVGAKPKKPFYKKWWVWAIAAVLVIGAIGSLVDSGNTADTAQQAATPAEQAPAAQPAPAPKAAPAPKWVNVITLSGNSQKRSKVFTLKGGEQELVYSVKGSSAIIFAVYVVDKGKAILKQGGIPEVTVTEAGKDSTALVKDAGQYYLDVQAANCNWTVTVREKR